MTAIELKCPRCNGLGLFLALGRLAVPITCSHCNGTGLIRTEPMVGQVTAGHSEDAMEPMGSFVEIGA